METAFTELLRVAAWGGRKDLFDTQEEICELRQLLNDRYEHLEQNDPNGRVVRIVSHALMTLDLFPSSSLSITNPNLADFPLCSDEFMDCYLPLVPLLGGAYAIFPVRSGGPFSDKLDYVQISESQWNCIVQSLIGENSNPADERRSLLQVVERFDDKIAYEYDIPGFLGNLIPWRGQQDCTDESTSLASLLHVLSVEGYLRFHSFDFDDPILGIDGYHYAAKVCEKGGKCFAVDTWSSTSMYDEELWLWHHNEQRNINNKPKH